MCVGSLGGDVTRVEPWPTRLVHIVDDAEVLADAGDLTLVCVLAGFLDAGKAAELAAEHLAELSEAARSWPPSTSTRSTTTAPGGRR